MQYFSSVAERALAYEHLAVFLLHSREERRELSPGAPKVENSDVQKSLYQRWVYMTQYGDHDDNSCRWSEAGFDSAVQIKSIYIL